MALVPVVRMLAHRTNIVARPRNDRWHRGTVPLLGGVAMAGGMFFGAILLNVAAEIIVPLSAAMAMFIIGLVDDALALKPTTKLIAQIAMAATMLYFGYRLNWLDSRLLDSVLTMVWIVGLTNAFNLLDNMDGLCAGIALIVALMLVAGLAGGAAAERAGPEVMFLSLLAGSVAGFLVFNFPPASIFMGDSGALLLGFSLATLTLGHEGVRASRSDVVSIIAGPAFVLLIPIFDTTLVTVSRVLSGRSPAMGGRDHSSHRLVAIGLSERSAVLVLYCLAAIGGIIGIALRSTSDGVSMAAGGVFLLAMCGFAVYLSRVHVYEDLPDSAKVTPLLGEFLYKQRILEVLVDAALTALGVLRCQPVVFRSRGVSGQRRELLSRAAAGRLRTARRLFHRRHVPERLAVRVTEAHDQDRCRCAARDVRRADGADRDLSGTSATRFRSSPCMRCR